jgi:molybdenum cofactor cytidylyltransferase
MHMEELQIFEELERPAIRRLVGTLFEAGIDPVIVVTGAEGTAIGRALAGLSVKLVDNPDPKSDMAASLRLGLRAVPADATGLLVCLADHPLVSAATVRALLARHRAEPGVTLDMDTPEDYRRALALRQAIVSPV